MFKSLSLRFSEKFAPACGTIDAHKSMIDKNGFVWYGKLGNKVSQNYMDELLNQKEPRILLINSGKFDRHWAYIEDFSNEIPDEKFIPEYYRNMKSDFKSWFKIVKIENAPRDIISKCYVSSSGASLSEVSRHSMNPCFKIEVREEL